MRVYCWLPIETRASWRTGANCLIILVADIAEGEVILYPRAKDSKEKGGGREGGEGREREREREKERETVNPV